MLEIIEGYFSFELNRIDGEMFPGSVIKCSNCPSAFDTNCIESDWFPRIILHHISGCLQALEKNPIKIQ